MIGNGLLPILPVYVLRLAGEEAAVGPFMATAYASVLGGSLVASWSAPRLGRPRRQLQAIGLVIGAALVGMSLARSFFSLLVCTCLAWGAGGMSLALIAVIAGRLAAPRKRAQLFALLAMTNGAGAVAGGLGVGSLAERIGVPATLLGLAALGASLPLWAQLVPAPGAQPTKAPGTSTALSRRWVLLAIATTLAAAARFMGALGTSLKMNRLRFGLESISWTVAIGALLVIPLLPVLGRATARVGPRRLLRLSYLAGAIGLAVLAQAHAGWHFYAARTLLSLLGMVSIGVASAFTADLLADKARSRALAMLQGLNLAGGALGMSVTPWLLGRLGDGPAFGLGGGLLIVAGVLLHGAGSGQGAHA